MKIINKGRGIHQREVVGIDRLKNDLPPNWIGFTNLELALPNGAREIDLIIIADDRILVVDLKDWNGNIESSGNGWRLNGRQMEGPSPVTKIAENRRQLAIKLKSFLQQVKKPSVGAEFVVPKVEPCVVLTGTAGRNGIAPTEVDKVFPLDFFVRMLKNPSERVATLGPVPASIRETGLTSPAWLPLLNKFFSVDENYVRASARAYGTYKAESDNHTFAHARSIFKEYDVADTSSDNAAGLLRRWDFTHADSRFMTEEGRLEIAGRERKVISWLGDRNPECESGVLQPRVHDIGHGVDYWEVFERRRRLQRLSDLSSDQLMAVSRDTRLQLLRQVILRVKQMHDLQAAHLDLGLHSVWIETPSMARLSHLMAATHPDKASLGESRYQFLSSVDLPEDLCDAPDTPQRKDVYLLGCIAHYLLLGRMPASRQADEPPEWDAALDTDGSVIDLHEWLARALQWEPLQRFKDAGDMLDDLNALLSTRPSKQKVVQALEAFRTISSQRKLEREFPEEEEICDDARVTIWTSKMHAQDVLVKLWKNTAWGDLDKEGERLLAFLEQAETLRLDNPPGCAAILRAIWLGDALVLVQEYIAAPTLAAVLTEQPSALGDRSAVLSFLRVLCQTILTLHERQIAHGDLKPDNILVVNATNQEPSDEGDAAQATGPQPVLIDLLDFSPADDGERRSTAYAPPSGGRFERDCFAVTKIAEEMLTAIALEQDDVPRLGEAVGRIRSSSPENATLLPLLEAIDVCLADAPREQRRRLTLVLPQDSGEPFLSDEGNITLLLTRTRQGGKLSLRGATEEIGVWLDPQFKMSSAKRTGGDLPSMRDRKHAFAKLALDIVIEPGVDYDLSALEDKLAETDVALLWQAACASLAPQVSVAATVIDVADEEEADEVVESDTPQETDEDQLAEAVAQAAQIADIDVPRLWSRLLKSEDELTISGTTTESSYYKEQTKRHHVGFQLESGMFDFAREDTVTVNLGERYLGHLDLANSTPTNLQIVNHRTNREGLIAEGQQLHFVSHFEAASRDRRRAATQRVLAGKARIRNLIDVLNPGKGVVPVAHAHVVDEDALMRDYELNAVQARAFAQLVGQRPVGLLQGPPGTGKTKFIAALVHYALNKDLAKNVLLASQSHEAVNGAAEAVLRLFAKDDAIPSVLRVGHEGIVSAPLLPYHVNRVEGLLKDRFRAELRSRLQVAGNTLALPASLVDKLIVAETIIRPIVERILELQERADEDGVEERIAGLRDTLDTVVEPLQLGNRFVHSVDEDYLDVLATWIATDVGFTNASKVQKFREVAELARDFIGSVSSRERSFETFLAGTRRIVAGTCVGLGRASLGLTATPFDLVIVDEAARCTPGELAVPLQSGRWVVLVGDHRQLEPQHRSEVVHEVSRELRIRSADVLRSDFERVFGSAYGRSGGASLTQQYRMLPAIGEIVSKAFYDGKLTHGRTTPMIDLPTLPLALDKPITWISTDEFGADAFQRAADKQRYGLENPTEAELIVAMIKHWDADTQFKQWITAQTDKFPKTIGVICTYSAQSKLIQARLRQAALSETMLGTVKVDTVDSYQGKENPIVILSLTRNNEDGVVKHLVPTIQEGFMAQPNRLNVAVSRAMDRLIIVGAAKRWREEGPMGLISHEFTQQVAAGQAEVISGVALKMELMDAAQTPKMTVAKPVVVGELQ